MERKPVEAEKVFKDEVCLIIGGITRALAGEDNNTIAAMKVKEKTEPLINELKKTVNGKSLGICILATSYLLCELLGEIMFPIPIPKE